MIYPSGDTIEQKVRSRYSRVILAAKRAKQIKEGAPILIDTDSTNPLTIAMEEIAAGKVTVTEAAIVEASTGTAAAREPQTHDDLSGSATLSRSGSGIERRDEAAAEDTSDEPAA